MCRHLRALACALLLVATGLVGSAACSKEGRDERAPGKAEPAPTAAAAPEATPQEPAPDPAAPPTSEEPATPVEPEAPAEGDPAPAPEADPPADEPEAKTPPARPRPQKPRPDRKPPTPADDEPESGGTSGALPGQGEPCKAGQCAKGLSCVEYYGIAGPRGPAMTSCEIRCRGGKGCPPGQHCATIADGPGQVCRPR
jgi:outer membrane biosynthesis protein TonB